MKKLYLSILFILFISTVNAQSTLDSAVFFNFVDWLHYTPATNAPPQAGPDYGCLAGNPGTPYWFYFVTCGADTGATYPAFAVDQSGSMFFQSIIWGPFDDTININSKLIAANIDTCGMFSIMLQLHDLQVGKIYYGMALLDTAAIAGSMTLNAQWRGGWWLDNRCSICNGRPANHKQDVCMVTLDTSTQHNLIIWEKKYDYSVASYNIYRETIIANQFDSIGNVPATSDGYFIDMAVNPFQRSYRYKLAGIDSCGYTVFNYSTFADSVSIPHATIHTQASPGFNGEVNLMWNAYEGFPYNTFYIYRGSSAINMLLLDSVASTTLSYTDFSPPSGMIYYKVTVKRPGGCSPDAGATVYYQAFSNLPFANIVSVGDFEKPGVFTLYPNPTTDIISMHLDFYIPDSYLKIYDLTGRVYASYKLTNQDYISTSFPSGVYIAELATPVSVWKKRFVVN